MSIMTHRATGAVAIASTLAPARAWQLEEIRVHLSAAGGAGNLTAIMDAGAGAAYDLNIVTQDMTSVINLIWQPSRPMVFDAGDEIDFAYANANGRTYGLEVKYRLI